MIWDSLKRLFGAKSGAAAVPPPRDAEAAPQAPQCRWIEAADNPWGVRLLDVRPITQTMISTSSNPQCASNAVSFGQEDGVCFVGQAPPVLRTIAVSLRFAGDGFLADGVLFTPRSMEHKWALFHHGGQIICVRSWLRSVQLIATLEPREGYVEITRIQGAFGGEDEDAAFTLRLFDALLQTHALELACPLPLPAEPSADLDAAGIWCMSLFGNRAAFATPQHFERRDPQRPLRTHSLLHIAVARDDRHAVAQQLAAGVPIDLLAGDGLAALHWAVSSDSPELLIFLLDNGAAVDVRSAEGATPLMNAVQERSVEKTALLLQRGADVNARDDRGFTAVHRAADMGLPNVLQLLLASGANTAVEAAGYTPRALAERNGHAEIVAALDANGSNAATL